MAGAGRPTKYKKEFAEQARKLCLLGHTDTELSKFFEVSESTINNWKIEHPEFMESIKAGKDAADCDVADRLFQRALGYSLPEVKVFNNQGEIITYECVKHYAPDPTAAMFWLKNRQPSKFRDRKSTLPEIKFSYDEKASPADQATQIIKAASEGIISADVANALITSISSMLKIKEVTDLEDRIKALEVGDE